MRRVGRGESGRNEVRRGGVSGRALAVHRVEKSVRRELRMEGEADEPALEPVIGRVREERGEVEVDRRPVVTRSEERRVGKECRTRWSPELQRKRTERGRGEERGKAD